MEYISVNNNEFKIAKTSTSNIVTSIDTVENNTESTRTLLSLKTTEDELNEEVLQYREINMIFASTFILSWKFKTTLSSTFDSAVYEYDVLVTFNI